MMEEQQQQKKGYRRKKRHRDKENPWEGEEHTFVFLACYLQQLRL